VETHLAWLGAAGAGRPEVLGWLCLE